MKKLLYLDVEWANPKNKSICQIGLVSEDFDTEEPILPELNLYVNPEDEFDDNCISVHHITKDKTAKCKNFKNIWNDIEPYFTNSIIVGHNVSGSDLNAIVKNLTRYEIDIPELYYIDTYDLSRKLIDSYEVNNYSLSSLCEYFDIDIDNEHDAFDDACACSDLLKKLVEVYELDLNNYVQHYNITNVDEFIPYVSSVEFRRQINTLYGVLCGMQMDQKIDDKETQFIINWRKNHSHYESYDSVKHIIRVIDLILEDNIITIEEINLLKEIIAEFIQNTKSSRETLATQQLQGLISGIQSDAIIDDQEIYELQKWIYKNNFLMGHYPYDLLFNAIENILEDGIITDDEKITLKNVFDEINNPLKELNNSLIEFKGHSFCLSGNFSYGSKDKVKQYIVSKGGSVDKGIKKSTNYLVIGESGSNRYSNGTYGTKVKKAKDYNITIIKESQLIDN